MTDMSLLASPSTGATAQAHGKRLANPRRTVLALDGRPKRGLQMIGADAADVCVDGVCAVPDQA